MADTAPPEVSVFVPCLNEEERIEGTIGTICDSCKGISFEILVANDGSIDRSIERIHLAQRARPDVKITVLDSRINRGLGYFYLVAAYVATGRYFIYIPGDDVVPAEQIQAILAQRGKADIIVPYFEDLDPRPRRRQRLSRSFTTTVNWLGGHAVKYYNGSVLHLRENVCSMPGLTSGPAYQAELTSYLLGLGASMIQVKVPIREVAKSGTVRLKNIPPVAKSLIRILYRRFRWNTATLSKVANKSL